MEQVIFEFTAEHKALGGIVSKVSVYGDRVVINRKISGILKATVHLPESTTVFFRDLSGILHKEPSLIGSANIGWIELSGINRGGGTVGTANVNGKVINNIEVTNALKNPYCIVYNKDAKAMNGNFARLHELYVNSKGQERPDTPAPRAEAAGGESPLEKIKKLKELLEIGAITQEDFDRKKAELLNQI